MKLASMTLAATLVAGAAVADVVAPGDVFFNDTGAVEVSLTGQPGDPANGAKIMKTKSIGNCIACHEVTALNDAPFHGEIGPLLDGAGDRWTTAELRGILVDAKKTFDGTLMPSYYKISGFVRPGEAYTGKAAKQPMSPLLSAQQIEDVIAFLSTLKDQ